MASEMVLADLLNKEGKIISTNWYYSTEIRIIGQFLFYKPLLKLFPYNWYLVRTLTQSVLTLLTGISYLYLATAIKKPPKKLSFCRHPHLSLRLLEHVLWQLFRILFCMDYCIYFLRWIDSALWTSKRKAYYSAIDSSDSLFFPYRDAKHTRLDESAVADASFRTRSVILELYRT